MQQSATEKERGRSGQFIKREIFFTFFSLKTFFSLFGTKINTLKSKKYLKLHIGNYPFDEEHFSEQSKEHDIFFFILAISRIFQIFFSFFLGGGDDFRFKLEISLQYLLSTFY